MGLLSTFEYGRTRLELFFQGTNILPNKVYIDGNLVLEDNTFRPSPLYNIDSLDCIISLLGFYAMSDKLSWEVPEELKKWANLDDAEHINIMIIDYELCDDEDWLSDNQMNYEEAREILKYITIQ